MNSSPLARSPKLAENYGRLPLAFEANNGQTDGQVKFLSRGRGYALFLTGDEAVLALKSASRESRVESREWKAEKRNWKLEKRNSSKSFSLLLPAPDYGQLTTDGFAPPIDNLQSSIVNSRVATLESRVPDVLRLKLVGANPGAKVVGLEPLPGKSNYFLGNDPTKWRTNVPNYAQVKYQDIYPGVDLVYYGNQGRLEHDFVVAPGADPSAIRFAIETGNWKFETGKSKVGSRDPSPESPFGRLRAPRSTSLRAPSESRGASEVEGRAPSPEVVRIDPDGDLVISTDAGDARLLKPFVYQPTTAAANPKSKIENPKSPDGRFLLAADNQISFEVGPYDKSRPLVIDPVLTYSTYLGGADDDLGTGIAVDSAGNAYVTGGTLSTDFPTPNPLRPANGGSGDVFVTKLNATGSAIVYSTYLGGSDYDWGSSIAVDTAGNAYVTGYTYSADFPAANALQAANAGVPDAFVTKLNTAGSTLAYSTYLGGSGSDADFGIAVDTAGNAYVVGNTNSTDFPTASPLQAANTGLGDAFVTKLNEAGSALVYSTYFGGSGEEWSTGIAVNTAGNAYVTGYTDSIDFPTAYALQPANAGYYDAFVTKLNAAGSALPYSTCLGGSNYNWSSGIAVDTTGNAYVAGYTASTDFPTADALQAANAGKYDAFVAKITPAPGARLLPAYLSVANQLVGSTSAAKTVTLTNTGDETLIVSVDISGSNAGDFTKTNNCGSSLAALGSCTLDVTFTPSATGNRSATLSITDNAAGSPHTVALTGIGTDFALGAASGGSTSASVSAGGTATYNLQVAPTGFSGTVALACAFQGSTPRGASCSVSSPSVAVTAAAPAPFTVNVSTTTRALATPQMQPPPAARADWRQRALPLLLALVMMALLVAVAPRFIGAHAGLKPGATALALAGALLVVLLWAACGGGGGTAPVQTGTPAGTYNLTVTGTAQGANRTTALTLNVS